MQQVMQIHKTLAYLQDLKVHYKRTCLVNILEMGSQIPIRSSEEEIQMPQLCQGRVLFNMMISPQTHQAVAQVMKGSLIRG